MDAYTSGMLIGALLMGVVLGLIPLFVGVIQKKSRHAGGAFMLTILAGLVGGIYYAAPAAILGTLLVLAAKIPESSSKDTQSR